MGWKIIEDWRTRWVCAGGENLQHDGAIDADAGNSIPIQKISSVKA